MGRTFYKLLLLLAVFGCVKVNAQCISVYPYTENFNGSTTQWFSGGIQSHWQRVVANKTYIVSTTKCWVTNGNDTTLWQNERSWVQSPCFDFTNLQYPYVQFDINWDCQSTQDGAVFQYSINGGPWQNVGSTADPVDCLNENWFVATSVNNLNTLATIKEGWSGSMRPPGLCTVGNGASGWKTAKHLMPNLAGQSNVSFRMAFGSGNSCLNFDGFAFDNVYIGEAPSNFASFAHGCASGIPLTYNFINTSAMCPTTHAWDFGDPNSGINNTSILLNPQHTFSAPGTYTVTLTESGPGNAPHTTSKIITTVDLNPNITPPSCTGDNDAKVQMVALNMYNPQLHTLNTGASTNSSPYVFNNLAAGTYTVTSQGADNCMIVKSFTIVDPPALDISNVITVKPNCISNTGGEISVFGTGGTGAYTYSSGGAFVNTSTLQPLSSGTYTVTLKDANGCTNTSVVELEQEGKPVINDVDILPVRCFNGEDGKVEVIATSTVSTVTSYSITPNAQQQSLGVFVGMNPGIYTIQVQDAQGCTESTVVELTNPDEIKLVTAKNRIFVCKPTVDTVMYTTQGGTPEYKYILQPNYIINTDGIFKDVPIGNYLVQVYDANECKAELPLKVEEGDCCSDIFIPTAFTPNGDGMNDLFKMNIFGTVLINKFQIVNRLGETVFNNEVTQGWDGYHNGSESPQDTYYYIIMYTCRNGKAFTRMGEVTLLR